MCGSGQTSQAGEESGIPPLRTAVPSAFLCPTSTSRVATAEAAIRQRMRVIFGRREGDRERQAIGKALSALSVLKETSFS